jgi:hypothetical protein
MADTPGSSPPTLEPVRRRTAAVSGALIHCIEKIPHDRPSIGQITQAFGPRAVPMATLMFALPNCVPAPPGIGSALGIPVVLLGLALMLGRGVWLPAFIHRRAIRRHTLLDVLGRGRGLLARLEDMLRPRLPALVTGPAERMLGGFVALLGLVICMPIPLTNFLPAIGAAMIGLGIAAGDGAIAVAGFVVGIVGLAVASLAIGTLLAAPMLLFAG